jgi:hypothetical protein
MFGGSFMAQLKSTVQIFYDMTAPEKNMEPKKTKFSKYSKKCLIELTRLKTASTQI